MVVHLGWVDIIFCHSTTCLILLGQVEVCRIGCGAGQDDRIEKSMSTKPSCTTTCLTLKSEEEYKMKRFFTRRFRVTCQETLTNPRKFSSINPLPTTTQAFSLHTCSTFCCWAPPSFSSVTWSSWRVKPVNLLYGFLNHQNSDKWLSIPISQQCT